MNLNILHPDASPPRRLMRGAAAALSHWARTDAAFTLIELLLVLALLAIIISISVPSLAPFFRGRTLDSEARRLLSLTRHGQSRAVSEGIPMLLWVDAEKRAYGLESEPGWDEKDPKALEFQLNRDLQIEAVRTNIVQRRLTPFQLLGGMSDNAHVNLPEIRFLPDGSIDENSPPVLVLSEREGAKLSLVRSTNGLNYEIATSTR